MLKTLIFQAENAYTGEIARQTPVLPLFVARRRARARFDTLANVEKERIAKQPDFSLDSLRSRLQDGRTFSPVDNLAWKKRQPFAKHSSHQAEILLIRRNATVPMATCPECDVEVHVDEDVEKGDIIECDDCGISLEVVGLDPIELDIAPDEDDDEYFDDDEDPY